MHKEFIFPASIRHAKPFGEVRAWLVRAAIGAMSYLLASRPPLLDLPHPLLPKICRFKSVFYLLQSQILLLVRIFNHILQKQVFSAVAGKKGQ